MIIALAVLATLIAADPSAGVKLEYGPSKVTDFLGGNNVLVGRTPRFIKFDTKENEVEIELGLSIPVVKVPLAPEAGRHGDHTGITVSAPGLVVAGALVLTTFLIVPLLFSTKTYESRRAKKTDDSDRFWTELQEDLADSGACVEDLICWTVQKSRNAAEGSVGKYFDDFFGSEWMQKLANGTFVQKAITNGRSGSDCWRNYQTCPIAKKLLTT